MLLQENILLNEFATEWIVCKVLESAERYQMNYALTSNILTLLSAEAVLESNKTNNALLPANSIELKHAFKRCATVKVFNDSVYPAIMYTAHNNLDYAKLVMHYVQYKCKQLDCRVLSMDILMTQILSYKTWHLGMLKQIWESQKIDNINVHSENLVDYMSAAGSLQFDTP
ncbi:hypothetical protein MA9V1_231 [Chryseobacterium phage MA9V-1]|nr:hypothetical protein MA9V1_231 [Chryseobacterium phage MA9V-1]